MALLINSTYNHVIKIIFYKLVFNWKPHFEHLNIINYYIIEADIKKYIYDDNQDNFLIAKNKESQQLKANNKLSIWKFNSISEILNYSQVGKVEKNSIKNKDEVDS